MKPYWRDSEIASHGLKAIDILPLDYYPKSESAMMQETSSLSIDLPGCSVRKQFLKTWWIDEVGKLILTGNRPVHYAKFEQYAAR